MYKAKRRPALWPVVFLAICALWLGGCTTRASLPTPTPAPTATPTPLHTVTYEADGRTLRTEEVTDGAFPAAFDDPDCGGAAFLGWLDKNGEPADPTAVAVTADVTYTAKIAPALETDAYYLTAEKGLFRPDDALTRREAAAMLYTLLAEKPPIPDELPDEPAKEPVAPSASPAPETDAQEIEAAGAVVEHSEQLSPEPTAGASESPAVPEIDPAYAQLGAVCAAGYMDAGADGGLLPDEAMTAAGLAALLGHFFRADDVTAALAETGEGEVTRAEAAAVMNALLDRQVPAANADAVFPDVAPDDARLSDIRAACEGDGAQPGPALLSDGTLYYVDEDGYCLRDGDVGTLHFGADGVYTSGSAELDALVTTDIAALVDPDAAHEDQLRTVYNYVRDNFQYLRCNYYQIGEHGWEIDEATNMLTTHYGNCYSFAAALWALARGIGYDAKAISGQIGENNAPHGWVDITLEDGVRYFFDVELEYAALRDGATAYPMFKLPWSSATVHWVYTYNWTKEGFPIT